jgi:hypothetical protein
LLVGAAVRGRITEKHLALAELTFPGIGELYAAIVEKPATFLQLVWLYEECAAEAAAELAALPAAAR